jgi:hypothetical protein
MLGMGDKKKLAMIIIGKKPTNDAPASSSASDFVENIEGDKKETVPSEGASAMDDAMASFMAALEAKDRAAAIKTFKNLVTICCSDEDEDGEEEL